MRSVAREHRIDKVDDAKLEAELREKIEDSDVLVAFTYPIYYKSDWLKLELSAAQELGVPVVAVIPQDNQRPAGDVRLAANVICNWDADEIARAIDDAVKASRESGRRIPKRSKGLELKIADDQLLLLRERFGADDDAIVAFVLEALVEKLAR